SKRPFWITRAQLKSAPWTRSGAPTTSTGGRTAGLNQGLNDVADGVEECVLIEQILVRVRGQTELRKQHDGRIVLSRALRRIDRALDVELRIGHANGGDSHPPPGQTLAPHRI